MNKKIQIKNIKLNGHLRQPEKTSGLIRRQSKHFRAGGLPLPL